MKSLIYRTRYVQLEDIHLHAHQPEDGQNIFFVDTTRMKHRKERSFTARQACAIESAGEIGKSTENVLRSKANSFSLF